MSDGDGPGLPTVPHATDFARFNVAAMNEDGGSLMAMQLQHMLRQGHMTTLMPDAHYPVRQDGLHAEMEVLPQEVVNIVSTIPGLDAVRARFTKALPPEGAFITLGDFVDRCAGGDVGLVGSHFLVCDSKGGAVPLVMLVFTFEHSGALVMVLTLRAEVLRGGEKLGPDVVMKLVHPHHFAQAPDAIVRLAGPALLYFDMCRCLRTISERATPME